jgi:uncharacterized protein YeaO (DUF488 family)
LAIRGHGDVRGATIGEVADYLLLRHHSAVGLIDRAEGAGLLSRTRDTDDHRIVRLHLSEEGAKRLEALSALHLEELERLARRLPGASDGLAPTQRLHGFTGLVAPSPSIEGSPGEVRIARVYDEVGSDPTHLVLVDRLWPRGLAKDLAPFGTWAKEVAPSAALRTWYGHIPTRFGSFSRKYRAELGTQPAKAALQLLRQQALTGELVLLTAAKDLERSGAAVLRDVLVDV